MNYSQYSLEGYNILVSRLGKNLKKILRSMYICLKEKWKKKSGVTPGGSGNPLKTGVLAIIKGLPDPLGLTPEFIFSFFLQANVQEPQNYFHFFPSPLSKIL